MAELMKQKFEKFKAPKPEPKPEKPVKMDDSFWH
jgi:hypothetical protein